MLKRKIYQDLLAWKANHHEECLVVKGARQVGKTYIIDQFARENYKSYIYLNFAEEPGLASIFEGSLSANSIYNKMTLLIENAKFIENDTLIFLDEIQMVPEARTALKFLALDGRFDVICSGSLLGIEYKEVSSMPVGYEKQIVMHSLDFEEFLWALGVNENSLAILKDYFINKEVVPATINDKYLSYLKQYLVIGGMPAVVNAYIKDNSYKSAYDVQTKILDSYLDDMGKYADKTDKTKIKTCFESMPRQLAKENRKFQYSVACEKGNKRKFASSLDWLANANIVSYCYNVSTPTFPLIGYEKEDQFKIYLNDIGLLVAMYGFDIKAALVNDTLSGPTKGGIYENLVADILIKKNCRLHYYRTDNGTQEIEFLIEKEACVYPVEVKAKNGPSISLNNYLDKFNPIIGYKLINGNIGLVDKKYTIPLYMAVFL